MGRETLIEKRNSIRLPVGKSVGHFFSGLLFERGGRSSLGMVSPCSSLGMVSPCRDGPSCYRKADWASLEKQTSKKHPSMASASIHASSYYPNFPWWWTVTWKCTIKQTLSSPSCFWLWYYNHRNLTKIHGHPPVFYENHRDLNSGPYACSASALIYQAISLIPFSAL